MNYKNYAQAYAAAQKIRQEYSANGLVVKIESSSYGGYQIKIVPIDLMIDNLSNNINDAKSNRSPEHC